MMKQDFLVIENSHICPTRPELNDRRYKDQKLTEAARPERAEALMSKAFVLTP